eukprot:316116_1
MPIVTLFIGPVVTRISAYKVFFAATLCYVLYIAANIKIVDFILYTCSVLVGIAAPCLWIARNVFITECSNHNELHHRKPLNSKLGFFNGIFWCIFQFHAVLGSIIGGVLFSFNGSIVFLYILFTAVCIIGVLIFCLIQPMRLDTNQNIQSIPMINISSTKSTQDSNPNEIVTQEIHSDEMETEQQMIEMMNTNTISIKTEMLQSAKKLISILKTFNFWCLVPLSMYSGLEQAFDSADFPTLITDNSSKFYILGYYGFISVVSSFIIGKISDKINRIFVMLTLLILHQLAWISLYFFKDMIYNQQNNIIFAFYATIFGIGFACIQTQKAALIPILLNNDAEVYQAIGLFESPSAAFIFYIHSYLKFSTKVFINSTILCIAVVPFFCFPSIRRLLKPGTSNTHDK